MYKHIDIFKERYDFDGDYTHSSLPEEELKQLVLDVTSNSIFTSFNFPNPNDITMVFPVISFLLSPPSLTTYKETGDKIKDRKDKLISIEEKDYYENVVMKEWEETEYPRRSKFLSEVGMIYEHIDKAMPRSINGLPMFMSCRYLTKGDADRFIELYKKYEKLKESF